MDPNDMTRATVSRAVRQTPIFTRDVIIWSSMGLLALGYVSIAALAPHWLEDLTPASIAVDPASNQGQRANARLAAELGGVRDSIAQIQLDMARIKTELTAASEREREYAAQLAAVERQLSATPNVASAAADQGPEASGRDTGGGTAEQTKVSTPTGASTAPKQPTVLNADTSLGSALETGSVSAPPPAKKTTVVSTAKTSAAAAPISFGPAVVKPAPQPVGLQISKGASVDSLRLSWSLLSERHGDLLGRLEPRFTSDGDPLSPTYDLVAGPIKTRADAMKVCKALAAQNVPCQVTAYAGNAL